MADTELGELYGTVTGPCTGPQGWLRLLGALTSLALVFGIGVWGYRLILRDVNGIPVIRALDGPMRIQPEDPGGERVAHQGLSVNEVAAAGEAGEIADALVLAPEPPGLLDRDLPRALLSDRPLPDYSDATDAAVAAVLDEAAGAGAGPGAEQGAPLLAAADADAVAPILAAAAVAPAGVIPASIPGVRKSRVPPKRPAALRQAAAAIPSRVAVAPDTTIEIDADSLPAGSRLVQLGAFESPEVARAEWTRIAATFAEVMTGKMRVIQQASSNGQSFYRLRVAGFADLADARRFCATLAADPSRPLCVPVATR